jgi:hypothetical protein
MKSLPIWYNGPLVIIATLIIIIMGKTLINGSRREYGIWGERIVLQLPRSCMAHCLSYKQELVYDFQVSLHSRVWQFLNFVVANYVESNIKFSIDEHNRFYINIHVPIPHKSPMYFFQTFRGNNALPTFVKNRKQCPFSPSKTHLDYIQLGLGYTSWSRMQRASSLVSIVNTLVLLLSRSLYGCPPYGSFNGCDSGKETKTLRWTSLFLAYVLNKRNRYVLLVLHDF